MVQIAEKYTKAQAKRAMMSINQKRNKLFLSGYLSAADIGAMSKISQKCFRQIDQGPLKK